jgi:hypothetical protein
MYLYISYETVLSWIKIGLKVNLRAQCKVNHILKQLNYIT